MQKFLSLPIIKGTCLQKVISGFRAATSALKSIRILFYETDSDLRNYSLSEDVFAPSADVCRQYKKYVDISETIIVWSKCVLKALTELAFLGPSDKLFHSLIKEERNES